MIHFMKLQHAPFTAMLWGKKRIEMRLYDEKRSQIKVWDYIAFTDVETGDMLVCLVVNMHRYANFEELYANHSKEAIGYGEDEAANSSDMLAYYSREQIEKYGVVGIEVELI